MTEIGFIRLERYTLEDVNRILEIMGLEKLPDLEVEDLNAYEYFSKYVDKLPAAEDEVWVMSINFQKITLYFSKCLISSLPSEGLWYEVVSGNNMKHDIVRFITNDRSNIIFVKP